jgi:hypothetical protein
MPTPSARFDGSKLEHRSQALDFDLVPMMAFSEAGRIRGTVARTCRASTSANGFSRG